MIGKDVDMLLCSVFKCFRVDNYFSLCPSHFWMFSDFYPENSRTFGLCARQIIVWIRRMREMMNWIAKYELKNPAALVHVVPQHGLVCLWRSRGRGIVLSAGASVIVEVRIATTH